MPPSGIAHATVTRMESVARSLALFAVAGLFEIGGGYLVWRALRADAAVGIGVLGGGLLVLYGVVATLQPANFGRVYAAYGGVFIAMALGWGWLVDGVRPDRFDLLGAGLAVLGVLVIMYAPRG